MLLIHTDAPCDATLHTKSVPQLRDEHRPGSTPIRPRPALDFLIGRRMQEDMVFCHGWVVFLVSSAPVITQLRATAKLRQAAGVQSIYTKVVKPCRPAHRVSKDAAIPVESAGCDRQRRLLHGLQALFGVLQSACYHISTTGDTGTYQHNALTSPYPRSYRLRPSRR